MELHELISYIEQYGYWALFFCLWLGIIGMPIPDEMIVMSGGFVSSLGVLSVICVFINIFRRCIWAFFRLHTRENIWHKSA